MNYKPKELEDDNDDEVKGEKDQCPLTRDQDIPSEFEDEDHEIDLSPSPTMSTRPHAPT